MYLEDLLEEYNVELKEFGLEHVCENLNTQLDVDIFYALCYLLRKLNNKN